MIFAFQDFSFVRAGFCNAEESLSVENPFLMTQVHSADVLVVDHQSKTAPECDALVTNVPDVKLTVKTADCAPVLFLDPATKSIAAAHAGWKGAFQGVLENTILTLIKMGADITHIHAAIGPHLTQKSFQVSPEMQALFPKTEHHFFESRESGIYFDFTGYLKYRLERAGLQHIEIYALDTFSNPDYNSYRRNKDNPARQYSFIQLIKGA